MKIKGASIRRFLDKPDKDVRAVLLYGPNESFAHEAAQKLAALGAGQVATIPTRSPSSAKTRSRRTARGSAMRWRRNRCSAGRRSCGRASTAKARTTPIVDALAAIERGEPSGYLIVEAGDLGGSARAGEEVHAPPKRAAVDRVLRRDRRRARAVREGAGEGARRRFRSRRAKTLSSPPSPPIAASRARKSRSSRSTPTISGAPLSVEDLEALMAAKPKARSTPRASRPRKARRRKRWNRWRGSTRSPASRRCARCCGACTNCATRARMIDAGHERRSTPSPSCARRCSGKSATRSPHKRGSGRRRNSTPPTTCSGRPSCAARPPARRKS